MAYMNQARKAVIAEKVKPILAKYGMKGSLSVRNHLAIVLTLTSGKLDFISDLNRENDRIYSDSPEAIEALRARYALSVNPYWYHEHYKGESVKFLSEIMAALKSADWYDRSDSQTDYFDTAYYYDVNIGKWDKPYTLTK